MNRKLLFRIILLVILALCVFSPIRILWNRERFFSKRGHVPGYIHSYPERHLVEQDTSGTSNIFYACENGITRYRQLRFPYENETLNSEGFRSPEFLTKEQRPPGQTVIGLIGDSFTFGSSAKPLSNCFADLLRSRNDYAIDNMGVEGADLHQYMLLTKWYAEKYHPAIIYIILSNGDYNTEHLRETVPYKPMYYVTQFGTAFPAFNVCGKFVFNDINQSRNYYKERYTMFYESGLLPKLLSKTNVGTNLWKKYFWNDPESECTKEPLTWWYLEKIDSICRANDVLWKPVIIPGRNDLYAKDSTQFIKHYRDYMRDFRFLFPKLQEADYVQGADAHINNSGHAIIGQMLDRYIMILLD